MKTAFRWFIFSVSHVEDFHGRAGRVEVWSFVFFQCIFLALADRPADLCGFNINSFRSIVYSPIT